MPRPSSRRRFGEWVVECFTDFSMICVRRLGTRLELRCTEVGGSVYYSWFVGGEPLLSEAQDAPKV